MALSALLLSGCGGSSTSGVAASNLTRSDASKLSADALTLAAREASDVWIPEATATAIDDDLKKIRQKYGQLEPIRARPENDLYSLILQISSDSPWLAAWQAGTLTTGESAVDDLLRTFKAVRVERLMSLSDAVLFTVHFEDPLNPRELARRFDVASSYIEGHGNGTVGDGDQIARETQGGVRVYTFSRGWGDCPAGCIYRRNFKVTLHPDGETTLEESGDDPTTTPGV
jgi:hypothetical protein